MPAARGNDDAAAAFGGGVALLAARADGAWFRQLPQKFHPAHGLGAVEAVIYRPGRLAGKSPEPPLEGLIC